MQAIPLQLVEQAVSVVVETVAEELVADRPITVRHFGTLSPYMRHGHKAHNVATGELVMVPPTRSVTFHAHSSMNRLLQKRRSRFLGKTKNKDLFDDNDSGKDAEQKKRSRTS